LTHGRFDDYVFSYFSNQRGIDDKLQKVKLDLSRLSNPVLKKFDRAIFLVGTPDQHSSPIMCFDMNFKMFINFVQDYKGSLVLLSSQAVYDDLAGEVKEDIDHVATKPYAISKQATESYARYLVESRALDKLLILRSKYIFGQGEKSGRLISVCAHRSRVIIKGKGESVLSPLPVSFVAKVLLAFEERLSQKNAGTVDVINLNYFKPITAREVVEFLCSVKAFDYEVSEDEETFPVRFYGNTDKLSLYLRECQMAFPNVWEEMKVYYYRCLNWR
jgi:nucleoside-diphosphate-sugar epimerase